MIFPEPTVFSKAVKSKVATPLPSSQSKVEVGLAVGGFPTVKLITTGSDGQNPTVTVA